MWVAGLRHGRGYPGNSAPPWALRVSGAIKARRSKRELLAPTYGWFTEVFDTRDLKEGKALLEELGVRFVTDPRYFVLTPPGATTAPLAHHGGAD
jgi:hypothetical protein